MGWLLRIIVAGILAAVIVLLLGIAYSHFQGTSPITPKVHASTGYQYYAVSEGQKTVTLGLIDAQFTVTSLDLAPHVAIYLNVGTSAKWLQTGVIMQYGDTQPYLYIEIGLNQRQVYLKRWPYQFGKVAKAKIQYIHGGWWAFIGNESYGPVHLHRLFSSALETFGSADAIGFRNGHIIRSAGLM